MFSRTLWRSAVLVLFVLALPFAVEAQPCTGDCNGDDAVTVDEIVAALNIALGASALATCPLADADGNGQVTVDEIVSAVTAALCGCNTACPPPPPTSTPAATPTPTAGVVYDDLRASIAGSSYVLPLFSGLANVFREGGAAPGRLLPGGEVACPNGGTLSEAEGSCRPFGSPALQVSLRYDLFDCAFESGGRIFSLDGTMEVQRSIIDIPCTAEVFPQTSFTFGVPTMDVEVDVSDMDNQALRLDIGSSYVISFRDNGALHLSTGGFRFEGDCESTGVSFTSTLVFEPGSECPSNGVVGIIGPETPIGSVTFADGAITVDIDDDQSVDATFPSCEETLQLGCN